MEGIPNGDQVDITSPAITDVLGSLADNFDILAHGDFDVHAFLSNLLDAVSESAAEEFGMTGSTLLCIIEVIEREIDSSVLDDVLLKLQKIREAITSLREIHRFVDQQSDRLEDATIVERNVSPPSSTSHSAVDARKRRLRCV